MKSVKTELWKSTHNPMFYAALVIGLGIALINVLENKLTGDELRPLILSGDHVGSRSPWGFSLFLLWMPLNPTSYGTLLYSLVWPILAAMPYGWSYLRERAGGLYLQTTVRAGRTTNYLAKYAAVFVSGGLAAAFPVLCNLLASAMICPYVLPSIMNSVQIADGYFLSELYFTAPWAYALLWCGVVFLLGGAAAGLCLLAGAGLRLQVTTMLTPFAILMGLDGLYAFLYEREGYRDLMLSPLKMVLSVPSAPNPEWVVLAAIFLMFAAGFAGGYWQAVKHELV